MNKLNFNIILKSVTQILLQRPIFSIKLIEVQIWRITNLKLKRNSSIDWLNYTVQPKYFQSIRQMMIKKFFSSFDMFAAMPVLRANGEAEVVNLCGGLFSICLFGIFVYIFISSLISIIKLEEINATQITKINANSLQRVTNVTIGVGLQLYPMMQMRNIFEVRAFTVNQQMIPTQIQTFPCTRDMWQGLTDIQYANLGLDSHMCVQREGVEMYGEFGASDMNMIMVGLYQCNNATSPVTCASPAAITTFFSSMLIMGRFLAASFVILDTAINPTSANPYSYRAYQKTLWMLFNSQQQIIGQVFLGTYEITTDTNFLPFETITYESGYYVSQAITTTLVNIFNLPIYVELYLILSPVKRVINRQFGKFDGVLSYVGGLYGIIVGFIAIFLTSFNQYKYQLRVGEGAFSYSDGHLARQSNLHFGKYLKYVLFDWIKKLTCCSPNWKDCIAISQTRQQAIQQIDVKHLLKRIAHLQKSLTSVISPQQENILFLTEAYSLQESKKRRGITEYCEKFVSSDKCITIDSYSRINSILNFGLRLAGTGNNNANDGNFNMGGTINTGLDNTNNSINNLRQLQFQQQYQNKSDNMGNSRLPRSRQTNSIALMKDYIAKYVQGYNVTDADFQLDQDDMIVEKKLAESFFGLSEQIRSKYIKDIPLGILYRLNKYIEEEHKKDMSSLIANEYELDTINMRKQLQTLNPSPIKLAPIKSRKKIAKKQLQIEYIQNDGRNK